MRKPGRSKACQLACPAFSILELLLRMTLRRDVLTVTGPGNRDARMPGTRHQHLGPRMTGQLQPPGDDLVAAL
jgi:hypothetical protein